MLRYETMPGDRKVGYAVGDDDYLYRRTYEAANPSGRYDRAEVEWGHPRASEFAPRHGILPKHGPWEPAVASAESIKLDKEIHKAVRWALKILNGKKAGKVPAHNKLVEEATRRVLDRIPDADAWYARNEIGRLYNEALDAALR